VHRARLTLAALVVVISTGAPSAHAQSYPLPPALPGFYGGGAIRDYLHFVSLHVGRNGALTADATLVTRCAPRFGDHLTETISVRGVQLDAGGRYSGTTSFHGRVGRGVPLTDGLFARGTIAFAVHVGPEGLARGTAQVRTSYSRTERGRAVATCDTGSIRWTARRPAGDAGTGAIRLQPGVHRGTTADHEPFLMRVIRGGRLVGRAGLTVHVDCPSTDGMPLDVVARRARVHRGAFHARGRFGYSYANRNGRRVVERYHWVLRGRFGSRGARGTFELNGVVRRRSDGKRMTSCSSGEIAWRASR
jgi:hypothetical protein